MSFKAEMHFHTGETSACAGVLAADGVAAYAEKGYDLIVVTDHFSPNNFAAKGVAPADFSEFFLGGFRAAKAAGDRLGVRTILGMELTFAGFAADFLVYGIDEELVLAHPDFSDWGLERFSAFAREHSALTIQAHPFRDRMERADSALIDGVEIINSNPRHEARNHLSEEWCEACHLIPVAGSDYHQYEDLAGASLIFTEEIFDSAGLAEALRNRKYSILYDKGGYAG